MATALPSMQAYPALPPPRATALRPISAGDAGARSSDKPQAEAEALREDELYRLRPEGAESHSASAGTSGERPSAGEEAGERRFETRSETPSFLRGAAAFLAQLLAQDEPVEEQPDPFGDASRAYERFREERDTSLFVDARDPIDVKV